MDGSESVRSGRSERSHRSHHSHHRHNHSRDHHSDSHRHHRKHHRHRNHDSSRSVDENRSVSIKLPPSEDRQHLTKSDQVEVQILPQDDNWADNTTAVTSETAWSEIEDMKMSPSEAMENSVGLQCSRYAGAVLAGLLATIAFLSPIAMVVIPRVVPSVKDKITNNCDTDCEGYFISFAFKLVILAIGTWALFVRRPKSNMPRVFAFRAIVLFILFLLTFAYWLFYATRILTVNDTGAEVKYTSIVQFSSSMVDALLFIHYVAVVLIEIRHQQNMYSVKIIRSPDGEARTYNIGQLSIQRAAVSCLEYYYRDFNVYNPYLENAIHRKTNKSNLSAPKFTVYDVDGPPGGGDNGSIIEQKARAVIPAAVRRRDAGHNERYYEEQEYERKVAKRRTRLITAAEEAFTHIKRLREESGPAIPMDSMEAAQAIFPSMARALQKFLRATRQQPAYPLETINDHLSNCLKHDMSPKAFLEEFLHPGAVINHPKQVSDMESWSLTCDKFLSGGIDHGTQFVLKKGDIALLCIIRKMPYFNISEFVSEGKDHKFVLRLNSETSV